MRSKSGQGQDPIGIRPGCTRAIQPGHDPMEVRPGCTRASQLGVRQDLMGSRPSTEGEPARSQARSHKNQARVVQEQASQVSGKIRWRSGPDIAYDPASLGQDLIRIRPGSYKSKPTWSQARSDGVEA